MGVLVIGLNVISNAWLAAPFLVLLGAIGGYLVVPMNALLQHRGANLMGAGRSIAVQNFNEQACILGLGAFYTGMTRFGLSAFVAIAASACWWRDDVADPPLAHRQLPEPSGRDRAPADDRPPRQALTRRPVAGRAAVLAALALVFNALVWGTSWWPFRWLQAAGLHPLWATALIYILASAVIVAVRPRAVGQVLRTPALWVLVAAAGTTNAAFNWGVVIGDVVRVVLLFYLMPFWTVVLAHLILGERFTALRRCARCWPWPARRSCSGPRRPAARRRARPRACRCRARSPTGWAWSAASRSPSTT
jgi:hypothetical protein